MAVASGRLLFAMIAAAALGLIGSARAQTLSYSADQDTGIRFPTGAGSVRAAVAPYLGAGSSTVVIARSAASPTWAPQALQVLRDQPSGLAGSPNVMSLDNNAFVGSASVSIAPTGIQLGDFNGDGNIDLFESDIGPDASPFPGGQNQLALSRQDGKLEDKTAASSPSILDFSHSSTMGDIDGDGDLDIFVANLGVSGGPPTSYFLINDGHGVFTKRDDNYPLSSQFNSSYIADVNFDGAADLILGKGPATGPTYDTQNEVMLGNGDGTFVTRSLVPPAGFENFLRMGVADFNRDGNPDIAISAGVAGQPTPTKIFIYPGTSDGWFAPAIDSGAALTSIADGVFPARVNDDCIPDVMLTGGMSDHFFTGGGSLNFSPLALHPPTAGLIFPLSNGGDGTDFAYIFGNPEQVHVIRQLAKPSCPITPVAAVLPSSRSVGIGQPITLFATMVNPQSVVAKNCKVGFNSPVAATFSYQTTNPATNVPTGSPNTPVDIPAGGFQTFVLSFTASEAMTAREMRFGFICDNAKDAAPAVRGVNTATLAVSSTPSADVITVAATTTNDGVARIPSASGVGFFAVSGVNIGVSSNLTVAPLISGNAQVTATVCETNPATSACLAPAGASVAVSFAPNIAHTFAVFLAGTGTSFSPDFARKRVRLEFKEAGGQLRGATGVAVCTVGAPGC